MCWASHCYREFIFQTENEELVKLKRQQGEKLAELTRLKTLIQENGFPNIEQFLMLQRQVSEKNKALQETASSVCFKR